jgi:hypothetical protein
VELTGVTDTGESRQDIRLVPHDVEKPSTLAPAHRLVIFINVVGCGTASPNPMGQNRRHDNESLTSRHNVSNPSR